MSINFIDTSVEYAKDKQLKKEDVKIFLEWINKQPHLPKINELQAILFLQSCYYRNEAAKTALDTFFTVKTLCPEMFRKRNPLVSPAKDTMKVSLTTTTEKLTPEGHTIIFVKVLDLNVEKYIFNDQCRLFDLACMLNLYQKGTSKGHVIVFDMKGLTFSHLTKVSPVSMKKWLFYLQEALPVRLKGLHFFNIVPFMDKVVALMKPFLKKELFEMMFMHNTVDDLVNKIPRECLPEDYGGTVESTKVLHEKMIGNLQANAELFAWEEGQVVDESRRAERPKNVGDIFGVEGTFKKLEID